MKKLTLLACLASLLAAGCGSKDDSATTDKPLTGKVNVVDVKPENAPGPKEGGSATPGDGK